MKKETLLIIHGLNNNQHLFLSLINHFSDRYAVEFITLPCHGADRDEAKTFEELMTFFDRRIRPFTKEKYSVIAFSLGALYLQLWLAGKRKHLPQKQVLLAPSLAVHQFKFLAKISYLVPSFLRIISFMPKEFRRFDSLRVKDYQNLIQCLNYFVKLKKKFKIPTLIIIDPKDELVSATNLEELCENQEKVSFISWHRSYLDQPELGKHHYLVHPRFFTRPDWLTFVNTISAFLVK